LSKTIKIKLNTRSINAAIKEVEAYRKRLKTIRENICRNLSEVGMKEASVRFDSAHYDGTNDSSVTIEPTENGYRVVASGNAIAFIEFGTGVHYNAGSSYPLPKPSGIVGIGEYGKKQGKKDKWQYKGDPGTDGIVSQDGRVVTTHGNPAQMPMYHATMAMQNEVERIVKEAFRNA
jgi:hypothetical protein